MNIKKNLFSDLKKIWEKENKPKKFLPGKSVVPVSGKVINFDEIKLMIESSLDGWLTTGRFNKLFEKTIAKKTGSKIAINISEKI